MTKLLYGPAGPAAMIVALFAIWEGAVDLFGIPRFLLPAPTDIARSFVTDWNLVVMHTASTLWGIGAGYLAAVVFGIAVAAVMIRYPLVERLVMPIFVAVQSVPKIAIAPLILLWVGAGLGSRVLVVASIAFFPIVINTMAGFKQIDRALLEVFQSVAATDRQLFVRLQVPYALPYIFAGLRIATTLSVIGAIVAEWLAASDGIGYLVLSGSFNFNTARSFMAIIMLAVIGTVFFALIALVEQRLSWRRHIVPTQTEAY